MSNRANALAAINEFVAEETQEPKREKYVHVNSQWPDVMPMPTEAEAMSAVKRLYRFASKRPFKGKLAITTGRRYTWPRNGVYYVNPTGHHFGGWKDIVHDVSHYMHWKLNHYKKSYKPHGAEHHFIEREMVAYVLANGFLEGKLKSKAKSKPVDQKAVRHQRVLARIKAWQSKRKRADNALKKLERQRRYYEK